MNASKELTEHRSEIFNRNEISYRFEFISPLVGTYCINQEIVKSISTLASYLASSAATFMILQQELILKLTEEKSQNGEHLRSA